MFSHLSLSLTFTSYLTVQCLQLESIYATTWTPISLSSGLSLTTAVCLLPLDDQGKFSSVQSLSHVRLFATPWTAAHQASLSITNSWSLLKLMPIESVMPSGHLILCHPLLLPPTIFPTIRVFSNESVLHIRWLKCWSFSFSISPSNKYSGLISFTMDWLDLFADQGLLSLLQHHSSKASILQHSDFFIAQLSYPYITTGKTIDLDLCWWHGPLLAKQCLYF